MPTPASSNGTSSSCRTTPTTGTPSRFRFWWTPSGRAGRASSIYWAHRGGFYYVLDRTTGEFLLGKPFAKQTWAKGLDAKGRPERLPNSTHRKRASMSGPAYRAPPTGTRRPTARSPATSISPSGRTRATTSKASRSTRRATATWAACRISTVPDDPGYRRHPRPQSQDRRQGLGVQDAHQALVGSAHHRRPARIRRQRRLARPAAKKMEAISSRWMRTTAGELAHQSRWHYGVQPDQLRNGRQADDRHARRQRHLRVLAPIATNLLIALRESILANYCARYLHVSGSSWPPSPSLRGGPRPGASRVPLAGAAVASVALLGIVAIGESAGLWHFVIPRGAAFPDVMCVGTSPCRIRHPFPNQALGGSTQACMPAAPVPTLCANYTAKSTFVAAEGNFSYIKHRGGGVLFFKGN